MLIVITFIMKNLLPFYNYKMDPNLMQFKINKKDSLLDNKILKYFLDEE